MAQFVTTLEQEQFFQVNVNHQSLQLYSKSTPTRLQLVQINGYNSIKPIAHGSNDINYEKNQCKFRIALSALLIKLYSLYQFKEHVYSQYLLKLKNIIFKAQLKKLVEDKGILRQKLMKNFAITFKNLEAKVNILFETDPQNLKTQCENEIIRIINCVPFFYEVLLESCIEQQPDILESQRNIKDFMMSKLGIEIKLASQVVKIYEKIHNGQNDKELVLMSVSQSQVAKNQMWYRLSIKQISPQLLQPPKLSYKKLSSLDSPKIIQKMKLMENVYVSTQKKSGVEKNDYITPNNNEKFKYLPQQARSIQNYLLQTIEDTLSPSYTNNSRSRKKPKRISETNQNRTSDVVPFDMKLNEMQKENKNKFQMGQLSESLSYHTSNERKFKRKTKKSERQNEGYSIWNIFCCS